MYVPKSANCVILHIILIVRQTYLLAARPHQFFSSIAFHKIRLDSCTFLLFSLGIH